MVDLLTILSGGSRPSDKGGGGGLKIFFWPFGPQFGLKISWGGGGGGVGGPGPLRWIRQWYWVRNYICPSNNAEHAQQSSLYSSHEKSFSSTPKSSKQKSVEKETSL